MSPWPRIFELPSRFGLHPLACLAVCALLSTSLFSTALLSTSLLSTAVGCEQESPLPTNAQTAAADEAIVTSNGEDDSDGANGAASQKQVLRHAVFFSFKEESTPEDIQAVVDAFAALPGKISEIIDFQHGTNNSPEGLDDGFTHCFLLTFKDEAGRAAYLPHPAHSGEFVEKLRPHMKDVFVIDYWGTPPTEKVEKELKHAVFFKFKEDATEDDIQKIEEAFAQLPDKIDAIKAFEWGINNSPEKHDDGFTHCFMVTFDSEEGREAYLPHPEHKAFVEVLMPVLDKVRVLDFWEN